MIKPNYKTLLQTLNDEYKQYTIYPERKDIYNALNYTDYKDVRVVILGQDPYHGPGQAHGLSFLLNPILKSPHHYGTYTKNFNQILDAIFQNMGI